MCHLCSAHRHLATSIGCGPQYRTWIGCSEAVNDDSWYSCHLSHGSVLRPTYVRCRTKHTNFMYREGCIWMKVCQRWCKLDRGPLHAHCAWKRPLASWNMQLPWLDSVPAGSQSLHKHSPTMFSWKLTTCGACPTVKLVEQVCLDWKDKACKELFLLWQSAWRESSSETIAMKNSQYNTAGACLKWFYAAHQVLKLTVCIKACFVTLQNYKFGLWQKTKQRMALDRPIDQTNKTVKKSQPLYFQSWLKNRCICNTYCTE